MALQPLRARRIHRPLIFDILCLIQYFIKERPIFIIPDIPLQIIIGGNQQIHIHTAADQLLPFCLRACDTANLQITCELAHLILPVIQHTAWNNDNTGTPLLLFTFQKSDDLQCFSKSHIICQNAPEAIPVHQLQPAKAILLIIT